MYSFKIYDIFGNMRVTIIVSIIVFFIIAATLSSLYADTLIMKDRSEIKGLVVDEYVDRITLSTVDGEKVFFRKDIDMIEYDAPEQNFMQLGREYELRGAYDKAAFYYKKASTLNPDYKDARDAFLAIQAKVWKQESEITEKEIKRREMIKDWRRDRHEEVLSPAKDKKVLLKETLGILLEEKEADFIIEKVRLFSGAYKAGVKEGDVLVSIWGKRTTHRKIEEIMDELIGPKHSEVRISIAREIRAPMKDIRMYKNFYKGLGILLAFEHDGLRIQEVKHGKIGERLGFKKGDFLMTIDGESTRYFPLDEIIAHINSTKDNKNIIFNIERSINLRRGGM